jgi:triosephosphate isomerase
MRRRPLVVGNWKMNGTLAESVLLTRALQTHFVSMSATLTQPTVDIVIAPPFTALALVAEQLHLIQISDVHLPPRNTASKNSTTGGRHLRLELGAQTMDAHEHGAFTGEISPAMLQEIGARWVILGHSERRRYCGETDAGIARKAGVALAHQLTPIIAVGETREQYDAGLSFDTVLAQTRAALAELDSAAVSRCVIAYEPIWAIGTGSSDNPERADSVMKAIRDSVEGLQNARLLYGGSVNGDNALPFFEQPNIDGALVGGASLKPDVFAAIVSAADEAGKVRQSS